MRVGLAAIALCAACAGPTVGEGAPSTDAGDVDGSAGAAGSSSDAAPEAESGVDASGGGPETLASGRDCPSDLRVHAGVIVWVDQGSLQNSAQDGVLATMPADGCSDGSESCIIELAKDQLSPSAVEIDKATNDIYWATIWDDTIWRLPNGSTSPEVFAAAQDYPRWLAIDQTALYWTNAGALGQNNGEIRRSWLDGSVAGGLAIVSDLPSPHALAVATGYVYWTSYGIGDVDGRVMGALVTGEGSDIIADKQSDPRGIAASASHVYWTNLFDGTIMRTKRDGTELTTLISGLASPSDVAVDSTGIYWVEAGTPIEFSDGLVKAARLDGSEITTLAGAELDPRRIELDHSHVYWINRGTQGVSKCAQHDGAIRRAPKPW